MGWVIGLLAFVLFVFSVLAVAMVRGGAGPSQEGVRNTMHEEFADAVHAIKVSRMAEAMKADREAALNKHRSGA
jgi:hypothetical protein